MKDVVSLGEMLIDFLPLETGVSIREVSGFKTAPGGAPANVAVGVARLGGNAAFIGKLGEDEFGYFLENQLQQAGVNLQGLVFTREARTGLAFVQIAENGERSFLFYRNPSADMLLNPEDLDVSLLENTVVFHHGSLTLIAESSRAATYAAIDIARRTGVIVSYDVNLRPHLWPSLSAAKEQVFRCIELCDILKVSEEELELLLNHTDLEKGSNELLKMGPKLVLVTLGSQGTSYRTRDSFGHVQPYKVEAVDTTGAGDGFMAGFLRQVVDRVQGRSLDMSIGFGEELKEMIRYGNAVGALTVTKMGAIPALPTARQVFDFQYANRVRRRAKL